MGTYRHFLVTTLLVALVSCSLIYTSCKNKCGSTVCQNGGTCSNNVCVCPVGYSGNSCQQSWSSTAVGTYTCTRSSCSPVVSGVSYWQSTITTDATNGGYTIDISNFNNSNTTVVATIDSASNSYIQNITISPSLGAGANASGYLSITGSVTTITLTRFTTYSGGVAGSTCEMKMVKE